MPSQPRRGRFGARIRNYFLTGLVIAAPLSITIYLTWWIIAFVDAWVKPLIPARYNPDHYLPFAVPGLGLIVAFISITLLGMLTANLAGRTLVNWGELMLDRMPIVRSIYRALKQIFETVFSSEGNSFQKVGLIEYPRRDAWVVVFISTTSHGEVSAKIGTRTASERGGEAEDMIAVFMPSTPNPTTGFLMYLPRRDVIELDMSVEEAAKLIISGGLVEPEYPPRLVPARNGWNWGGGQKPAEEAPPAAPEREREPAA